MTKEEKFETVKALGLDDEIYWIAERLLEVHPQRELLDVEGCLSLAQFAYTIDAIVLPVEANEVHVYEDRKTKELVIQAGINYFRRKGNEAGGYMMFDPRPMDTRQLKDYGVSALDLGFICKILPNRDLERIGQFGMVFVDYLKDFAFVGSAVVTAEEMHDESPPKGRTWAWVGMKRCERDALSKAFPHTKRGVDVVHTNIVRASEEKPEPIKIANGTLEETNELLGLGK